jgi:hypothetical protein
MRRVLAAGLETKQLVALQQRTAWQAQTNRQTDTMSTCKPCDVVQSRRPQACTVQQRLLTTAAREVASQAADTQLQDLRSLSVERASATLLQAAQVHDP